MSNKNGDILQVIDDGSKADQASVKNTGHALEVAMSRDDATEAVTVQELGPCKGVTNPCPKPKQAKEELSRENNAPLEITRDSLTFIAKLTSGEFGEVWRGKWNNTRDVAIKTLKPEMSPNAYLDEVMIMNQCRHDKLVQLYGVCSQGEPVYIITELMSKGTLIYYLREGEGRNINLVVMLDMSAQIANGMTYLEQNKIIHRDLAARSIYVGENNIVKVGDFGLAKVMNDSGYYLPYGVCTMPLKWTAPEAALSGRFTIKSDIWSYGILLMEIVTKGAVPYQGMTNQEVPQLVADGYRMSKPSDCPDFIYEMMLKCWYINAENRPTFEFLFVYFNDYFVATKNEYSEVE